MSKKWEILNNPPVVLAIFQILFEPGKIKLDDTFHPINTELAKDFPLRRNNIETQFHISPATSLGKSTINGESSTKTTGFTYTTKDQKLKLDISDGTITYSDENEYKGWEEFKKSVIKFIGLFEPILSEIKILRTSIRFINQFEFEEFKNPEDYFNTVISSNQNNHLQYPLLKYGFRMTYDIKEGIYSIINQNADKVGEKYTYILDIDVLNRNIFIFDITTIAEIIEELRDIKNDIFFNNITEKTKALCNLAE